MQHLIMAFYILFFATGFMGGTALLLVRVRMRSRLLSPLLIFQILFFIGTGLIILINLLLNSPVENRDLWERIILFMVTGINTAIWAIVIILIRRVSPPESRLRGFPAVAAVFAFLVALKSIANMVMVLVVQSGASGIAALTGTQIWNMGGHILTGLAMASFGILLRGPLNRDEPSLLTPLLRSYGLCALIFAPAGIIEAAIQSMGLTLLSTLSLDHLFYFAWNIISMSAVLKLFTPSPAGNPRLDEISEERVKSLKLSAREREMALLIARGLSNKEIAGELFISPATVRTHIYNLYQKVEARSRVELINKLRD